MATQEPPPEKQPPPGDSGDGTPPPEPGTPPPEPESPGPQAEAPPPEAEQPAPKLAPKPAKGKPKKRRGFVKTWFRTGMLSFLAVLALLCGAFYLFLLDGILRWGIQRFGSQAWGAKVEVESLRSSLFPPTLALAGVRAANPESPMRNAAEAAEMVASFDPVALFSGRVYIEEVTLRDLRLDTPRETSGALEPKDPDPDPDKDPEEDRRWLPTLEMPDVEKILEEEDLESVRLAEQTEADIREAEARWKERIESLKERWAAHEAEVQELRRAEDPAARLRAAAQIAAKVREIQRDIEELRAVRAELGRDVAALRERTGEVRQAVPQDAAHLKDKYATGPEALGNAAEMLFGEQAALWANRAGLAWPYLRAWRARSAERAKQPPPPQRTRGRFVAFGDETEVVEAPPPRPRFMVGKVHFSGTTELGSFSGEARDLTDMPSVLGRPASLEAYAEALDGLRAFSFEALFDHVRPDSPEDRIVAQVRGLDVRNMDLSGPARLAEGAADIDVDFRVVGEALEGGLRAAVADAIFVLADDDLGEAAQAVASALAGVTQFDLAAIVGGTVNRPSVSVRSPDLEGAVGDAMGALVSAQAERLEAQLRQGIADKVGARMGGIEERLGALSGLEGDLGALLERAADLARGATARQDTPEGEQRPSRDPIRDIRGILGR